MISHGEDERLWPVVLIVFLGHWCFSIMIMIENFFLYFYSIVLPGSTQASLYVRQFFVRLPFLQLEYITVALGCGMIGGVLWRWALSRWGVLLFFFTALNAYLVLNQIGYRVFCPLRGQGPLVSLLERSPLHRCDGRALA